MAQDLMAHSMSFGLLVLTNDPKLLDRRVRANSVDPDQMASQ